MPASVMLAAMLGIVAYGFVSGGGFSAKFAALAGRNSRRRIVFAFAAGTAITYGLSSLVTLALLGRLDALAVPPWQFAAFAAQAGIPYYNGAALGYLGGCLLLGMTLGVGGLLLLRRLGRRPPGMAYRSPAAMSARAEWPAAAALALAAGIAEELFFRLTLPLLVALVTGSALAGFALSLAAFAALHRHQGWPGIVATGLIGAALTLFYLATGRLWVAALLHVLIDLNALVLRPMLFPSSSAATPS